MIHKKINVVIADDNHFFCEALKDSLNTHKEINVINTFTTLKDLISYTKTYDFDVLILDINFNGENSLDHINELKKTQTKIIALTTLNNDFIKDIALKSGVDVFIGKDEDYSNFKNVIIDCYINNTKQTLKKRAKVKIDNKLITKHKLTILQAIYTNSDKSEKELSELLNISVSSLKTHKRELFEITNTKSTPELLKYGIQKGLIIT